VHGFAAREELIASIRLGDHVLPLAAVEHVHGVVLGLEEAIVAVAAVEEVGIVAARNLVVARLALDDVLARAPVHLVVAAGPGELVVVVGPDDLVGAVAFIPAAARSGQPAGHKREREKDCRSPAHARWPRARSRRGVRAHAPARSAASR
jgi:hypothetical protein